DPQINPSDNANDHSVILVTTSAPLQLFADPPAMPSLFNGRRIRPIARHREDSSIYGSPLRTNERITQENRASIGFDSEPVTGKVHAAELGAAVRELAHLGGKPLLVSEKHRHPLQLSAAERKPGRLIRRGARVGK